MIRDLEEVVRYVAHEEEWKLPQSALVQRLVREHPWQDVRSSLGYLLQWLHVNLVRERPDPMPLNPRFRPILSALLSSSRDLAQVFNISGEFLGYSEAVPQAQRRDIEEYVRKHYRPETVV